MEISGLKEIGLTTGELRIYKSLLELGETTRTTLSKKSGISPSKIYDVANRLLEKGIISSVKKNGVLHFSAANPERLKDFINSKEEEIKKEKEIVNSMMSDILLEYNKTKLKTDVEVFYGWEGMKTAFNDILLSLNKGDENLIFGASQGLNSKQADLFFSQYYKRQDNKGYKIKIIFNEELRKNKERTEHFIKSKIHEIRFLHNDTFTELNLYKDVVQVIMLLENPMVIRIKNKEAADAFRKFFNTMWKMARR